jgi:hypothetical protein
MVDLWRGFASGPNPPDEVYVVIELTRGSRNKYEYDARNGVFRLDRVLYTYFPCDYGFIPQTLDDDGDPLDAVLLINEPTFTGCVALARPVANIKMVDEGAPRRQDSHRLHHGPLLQARQVSGGHPRLPGQGADLLLRELQEGRG